MSTMVNIAEIVLRPEWQARKKLNEATIARYKSVFTYAEMPPIDLSLIEGALVLTDGWHRLAAAKRLDRTVIEATVTERTEDEAHWEAMTANTAHGLPLHKGELREVFRVYVKTNRNKKGLRRFKSYREIAEDLNGIIGKSTAKRWMDQDFPIIAAKMRDDNRPGTTEPPEPKGSLYLREALAYLEQIIARARGLNTEDRQTLSERLTKAAATVLENEPHVVPPPDALHEL